MADDIELLKMLQTHYLQDLREFWVRNNMYLVINGALVSVYASTAGKSSYSLPVAVFGLIISCFWVAVARASYRWLHAWREELIKVDDTVDQFQIYRNVEMSSRRGIHSPAWVTQWLPAALALTWVVILLAATS